MPELGEYVEYLDRIWRNRWLTNNGPIHEEFESALASYLNVEYLSLYSNATVALISAFKCLALEGEVITTPYSFVATTHALDWNGLSPVFCDVDEETGNINPREIEKLISEDTSAILPVHVYGNPCAVTEIDRIAKEHNLKIVYDAAHAFNVQMADEPVVKFGDLSVLSFHATKVFSTIEGGAIICKDRETKQKLDYFRNFGFENEVSIVSTGVNAKMNELQAAFGMLQLKSIDVQISDRRQIAQQYRLRLGSTRGIRVLDDVNKVTHNYSYFPIFVDEHVYGLSRDNLYCRLKDDDIYARRYFYPLISNIPAYKNLPSADFNNLINANRLAKQVLCLPIYPTLEMSDVDRICSIINGKGTI